MSLYEELVQSHIFCRYSQLPSLGHRVTRIDAKVKQDLVDLSGVRVDLPEIGGQVRFEGDALGESLLNHLEDLLDEHERLEVRPVPRQPAPEHEQLAYNSCTAFCAVVEHFHKGFVFGVLQDWSKEVSRYEKGSKDIVQVMGDSAGQRANALHSLRAQ